MLAGRLGPHGVRCWSHDASRRSAESPVSLPVRHGEPPVAVHDAPHREVLSEVSDRESVQAWIGRSDMGDRPVKPCASAISATAIIIIA